MMKKIGYLFYIATIIALLLIAGCVAPPKELSMNANKSDATAEVVPSTTSTYVYVTPNAPFYNTEVSPTETLGYHKFASPTPLPEEKSCRIYTTTQTFVYNGSAFTFDLKNPPMYINYTVIPTNTTGTRYYTSRYSSKPEVKETYSMYDPQSFLEITVRNKSTGDIYFQDGFGKEYSTYLTRTLKVLKQDDLLVEIKGNKMKATINFWVKPMGNFEDPDNMTFDACTYWGESPRDVTAVALGVTTTSTPVYNPNVPTATLRPIPMETFTPQPTHTAKLF